MCMHLKHEIPYFNYIPRTRRLCKSLNVFMEADTKDFGSDKGLITSGSLYL